MVQKFEMLQKQTQKLILSPQMQQAIYMLQMPLMELQTLIQQELTLNPVLEENLTAETPSSETKDTNTPEESKKEESLDFKEEFSNLEKLDDEWREYFAQSGSFKKFTQQDEEKRRFMMESVTTSQTLQDHLMWQLGLIVTDPLKRELGEVIIGNIDDNGYLRSSTEDLVQTTSKTTEEVEEVIALIQTFNPVGVGARDIKECLLIQLDRLGKSNTLASKIIENHLDLVGDHKYKQIAELLQASEEEVINAVDIIVTLDPKPGLMFGAENTQYVVPDVYVEKTENGYTITLNDERVPHLYISNLYRTLMHKKDTPKETINYIREKIKSGSWLIRNIQQRQKTIYRIADEIIRVQQQFFEEGPVSLKPLTMQDVASAISLHESTVSRAIAGKFMQSPQGTFQFKYFFSSGITTEAGESISVANLKNQIADMIKEEDPKNPFSDQEILDKLAAIGIKLARRTIAKYRNDLGIAASSVRRKV